MFFLTGEESTLFVVLVREGFKLNSYSDDVENFMKMIGECVRKTLSLIPGAKLLIANTLSCLAEKAENTLLNATGVFARKDWSNNDAGSSEKALANFGPHISDAGIKKIITRRRNIS